MKVSWARLGSAAFIVLIFLCAGALLYGRPGTNPDFAQDFAAALALRNGFSIYGPEVAELAEGLVGKYAPINAHPPILSLLVLPFTLLSFEAAYMVWGLISWAIYIFAVRRASDEFDFSERASHRVMALSLVCFPFVLALWIGNVSLLVPALLIFSWAALRQTRDFNSGLFLGAAAALKLYPLIFLLTFFILGRKEAIKGLLAGFAAICLFSLMFVGAADFIKFFAVVCSNNFAMWRANLGNQSIAGPSFQYLGGSTFKGMPLAWVVFLGGVLLVLGPMSTRIYKAARSADVTHAFCLTIAGMLLVSPLSWSHTYCALILPAMYFVRRGRALSRPVFFLAAAGFLLASVPDLLLVRYFLGSSSSGELNFFENAIVRLPLLGLAAIFAALLLESNKGAEL